MVQMYSILLVKHRVSRRKMILDDFWVFGDKMAASEDKFPKAYDFQTSIA